MPTIAYKECNFRKSSLELIEIANNIVFDYAEQGYSLTLRQIYYQLVARGFIENSDKSYNRIGNLINEARLGGLMDWNSITDRTRNIKSNPHWSNPREIIEASIAQYNIDVRKTQPNYIEVWVEKEALIDIVGQICTKLDVTRFACRGYVSQSEMWTAAQRFRAQNKDCYLIHLGDHDPSGIDMTRDISDRLELFGANVEVLRIALNFDQIEEFAPPPNPAKVTDSRAGAYIKEYGKSSWELDALEPHILTGLISEQVERLTDDELLATQQLKLSEHKKEMQKYLSKIS